MSSMDDALRERGKEEHNDAIDDAIQVVLTAITGYSGRWNREVKNAENNPPDYGDLMNWYASRSEVGLGLLYADIRAGLNELKYTDDEDELDDAAYEKAFAEGQDKHSEGEPKSSNPYPVGRNGLADSWDEGWGDSVPLDPEDDPAHDALINHEVMEGHPSPYDGQDD